MMKLMIEFIPDDGMRIELIRYGSNVGEFSRIEVQTTSDVCEEIVGIGGL